MFLPEKIKYLIAEEDYAEDDIGMSAASVLIYENKVLKIQEYNEEAENECVMMQYLHDKLPVPTVYAHEIGDDKSYLLMSKCEGQMSCSPAYMSDPLLLCKLLADGLKRLWSVDAVDCPSNQCLSHKLMQAKYNIENNLVDLDNVEPDTFGEGGFKNPAELFAWLCDNAPAEELALSHGDYCLPNIFGIRDEVSGFIDLGKTGIADKWCDIAICYRSLLHNYSGKYKQQGCHADTDFDSLQLFHELGIEPDWKKIRYYMLLDELF